MTNLFLISATLVVLTGVAHASTAGCFARSYDRAHLAKHPDQTVTAVKLQLMNINNTRHDFKLTFNVRGSNKTLRSEGLCLPDPRGGMKCIVECDGGGVQLVHRANDVMMHLDWIRVTSSCDENPVEDGQTLSGGKDDRDFRLDRVSDALCVGMVP